jgi:hypothetical protein
MVSAAELIRGCHGAGMSSAPQGERMNVVRHAAAPWEPLTFLPVPEDFRLPLAQLAGERLGTKCYVGDVFPVRVPPFAPDRRLVVGSTAPIFAKAYRPSVQSKPKKRRATPILPPPASLEATLAHAWQKRGTMPSSPQEQLEEEHWPQLPRRTPQALEELPVTLPSPRQATGAGKVSPEALQAPHTNLAASEKEDYEQLFPDGFPWTQESQGASVKGPHV